MLAWIGPGVATRARGEVCAGLHLEGADPFLSFDRLMATQPKNDDPSHAFYLGYEMAKALTALTLGKDYRQDDIAANVPGMDFFDAHSYWNVTSGVLAPADADEKWKKGSSMIEYFSSRAPEGYPWMASEWNNQFKLDGPMLMAGYGALQGWDALFQYRMDGFDGARTTGNHVSPPAIYLQYPLSLFDRADGTPQLKRVMPVLFLYF